MVKVLRLKAGESICLIDGCGRKGIFSVTSTEKSRVHLECCNIQEVPAPGSQAVIAVGWTKAIRRSWLLEKAVELEAGGVWLWQAEYSQGKVPPDLKDSWQGQLIAGAKQSSNPWLPELRTVPDGVAGLIELAQDFDQTYVLWEGQTPSQMLSPNHLSQTGRTLFVLGPEGGFSEKEIAALISCGFSPMSLGQRILRWETAALLCLGLHWWHRQLDCQRQDGSLCL